MTVDAAAERRARLVLGCAIEPGSLNVSRLVEEAGAVRALRRLLGETDDPGVRQSRLDLAARIAAVDPDRVLADASRAGLRFVVPGEPEWPDCVDDLAHAPELYERGHVPVGLWLRGTGDLRRLTERSVAVVGSRSCTSYGIELAREISAGVASAGYTVVSGGAFGIDQAAHRGALSAGGRTIAVLACGADRAYPTAHRPLLDYIAENGGVVVSESPPGWSVTKIRFLARNRLIAALGQGTVVVEAALRSGALNTATWAGGMGRELLGVPGPVTSAPSEGVHQFIRSRGALLVTSAAEVLEAVGPIGAATALAEPREPARPHDHLSQLEQQVLDAVPVMHGAGPDNIARTAGLAPDRVRKALAALLEGGFVERSGGRWRLVPAVAG